MATLDWKWVGIGVLIMLALSVVGGLVISLVLAAQVREVQSVEEVTLSGGQIVFAAIVNFLVFLGGGFLVGLKSAGRTVLEPGLSAAIAVLIGLIASGNFTLGNVLIAGLVPFGAGVFGGWLGERRQARV